MNFSEKIIISNQKNTVFKLLNKIFFEAKPVQLVFFPQTFDSHDDFLKRSLQSLKKNSACR